MADYTPTGKPDDVTRYDSRAVRREFELIAEAISTKAAVGASSTVSTTSMLIESPATKTFTAEPNKEFAPGQTVYIADATNPTTNSMTGLLTSYDIDTGEMVVEVTAHDGSGTISNWVIGVSNAAGVTLGSNTFSGAQNFARATRASHPTNSLIWNAPANQINFTGTANVTALPNAPQGGAERVLICADACSFTAGANILIDGVQSGGVLQCAANDIVLVRATSVSTFRLSITRYAGNNGGATEVSSAVDVVLTTSSNKLQNVTMTAVEKNVILPDALTVGKGFPIFAIRNKGLYPFGIKKNGGAFLGRLNPGQSVILGCADNSTSEGVWSNFGQNIEDIYRGNTSEVINAVDSRELAVTRLTSTKALCVFRNTSTTFINAVILNFGAASGLPVAVNAEASFHISVTALTATQAVVVYKTSTGVTKGYVLDISGNSITPGTVKTIDADPLGTGTSLTALSTTQLLIGYYDSQVRERVLTVSGSTISEGAETLPDATASTANSITRVSTISATKALYTFRGNSPLSLVLRLQSISGSTPTPTGSALSLITTFTDTNVPYSVSVLSADRAIVVQTLTGNIEGDLLISLIDVSGVTPVLLYNKVMYIGVYSGGGTNFAVTRLSANTAYIAYLGGGSLGLDSFVLGISSDDRLFVGPITEAVELNVTSAAGYLDCAALDSTHVMNVCRNSSTYLAAKVTEVAT